MFDFSIEKELLVVFHGMTEWSIFRKLRLIIQTVSFSLALSFYRRIRKPKTNRFRGLIIYFKLRAAKIKRPEYSSVVGN